jgi:hypothetical protein
MTLVDSSDRVLLSPRWRVFSALAGLALAAALVAFMATFIDRAWVTGHGGLARVTFGYPLGWLAQNQTALDPSFPARLSPAAPWENPTSVAFGPLLVDVLVVYAVLLVGWFVGRSILRRITTAAP